ncbi:phosphatase 2C-like domain-containing protein [Gorgonomyces haynaldii]|nr:phosphatase 2C-like domain-containing protein [Gorgonomyces haynaldii]
MISDEQKQLILTQNESKSGSLHGLLFWNAVRSNDPIEDRYFQYQLGNGILMGVFDGHGGGQCADLVKQYLASYIQHRMQMPVQEGMSRREHISSALRTAFMELDQDILQGVIHKKVPEPWSLFGHSFEKIEAIAENIRAALAGSCALVAYCEGKDVYVACTGDSRALVGKSRGFERDGKIMYEGVPLSVDQTLKNPAEYMRIMEEHPGEETTVFSRGRVLGGLMPTRAFGDAVYKWPRSVLETVLPFAPHKRIRSNYKTPPYVTAMPEVVHYEREDNDKFLILATDGLWDELENEQVAQELGDWYQSKDGHPCTRLIKRALGGPTVSEERITHHLSIPAPQCRRYRDDITVGVLLFDYVGQGLPLVLDPKPVGHPQLQKWVEYLQKVPKAKL